MTAIVDDDRPLIEAAQADPARFIELYQRYFDRVYAFASSRTRNRAVAEDVTSEVFHQALAHIDQFEWRGVPFVAWLFRMASNAIVDRYRQDARDSHALQTDMPDVRELEDVERRVKEWAQASLWHWQSHPSSGGCCSASPQVIHVCSR